MLPTKFPALLLILTVRTCSAGLTIKTSKPDVSSYYVQAAVNVVTSCYSDRGNAIGVAGDVPENFLPTLWSRQLISVVLLAGTSGHLAFPIARLKKPYGLQLFVVGVFDVGAFDTHIIKIRTSVYWNPEASFIILYRSPKSYDGCWGYADIFYFLWKLDILNGIVMCANSDSKLVTYAFNPYTNEAPDHWPLFESYPTPQRRDLYVYGPKYFYEMNNQTCDNLDFDKTRNLAGYRIVVLHPKDPYNWGISSKDITLDSGDKDIYRLAIVQRYFNMTIRIVNVRYGSYTDTFVRHHADMRINSMVNTGSDGVPTLYPHSKGRLFILTHFRGHKSQLRKILFVIDRNSRIGLCLVLLVTWMFFKYIVHQGPMPAFLNIIRLVCATGFENIPDTNAARLYLAGVLMFAVTMQGIYQGQLASLLTNHVPIPDVNTLQELIDSEYTVYGFRSLAPLFDDRNFKNSFIRMNYPDCSEPVIVNSSNACIQFEAVLPEYAKKFNLHISREPVTEVDLCLAIRYGLPLKYRLNKLMLIIQEADLRRPVRYRAQHTGVEEFVYDELVRSNAGVKVMVLKDLAFAFVILGIGLAFATITFIAELAIDRFRSRVRTVRVQVLN